MRLGGKGDTWTLLVRRIRMWECEETLEVGKFIARI